MKVRVYGFEWKLGEGISIEDFCMHLNSLPGPPASKRVIAIYDIGEYFGGVIVSIKDMKTFCKMKHDGSNFTIEPQALEKNTSIADFNFFILNKITNKGLYQHYHHSAATTSFCNICLHHYNHLRIAKIKGEVDKAGGDKEISQKQRKAIHEKYKGYFSYSILVKPENFRKYVAQMKSVKDFTVEFSSISESEKNFLPASEFSKKESHKFTFIDKPPLEALKEKIFATMDMADAKKAQVSGTSESGESVTYKLFKDYSTFEEMEYEDIVDHINMNSEDIESSIKNSEIIKRLLVVANKTGTKQLLTNKTK